MTERDNLYFGVIAEIERLGFVHENYFYGTLGDDVGRQIYELCFFYYMKVPDGFVEIGEEDREEMFMYAVNSTSGDDKARLLATEYDAGFWSSGETIHIYFFNPWLGSKDGRNYPR